MEKEISTPEIKNYIFEKYGYLVEDEIDSNNFFKSVMNIDKNQDFVVDCKSFYVQEKGILKKIDTVLIDKNQPFDAFIEPVWNSMTIEQRAQVIKMTINYFINADKLLKDGKIGISFFNDNFADENVFGLYHIKNNTLAINPGAILRNRMNPIIFLKTIIHELVHAKQFLMKNKNEQLNKKIENLNEYEQAAFKKVFSFNACYDLLSNLNFYDIKHYLMKQGGLTNKNIETLVQIFSKEKKYFYHCFRNIFYVCDPLEYAAMNREFKVVNKIINSLNNKYNCEVIYDKLGNNIKKAFKMINQCGFMFEEKDIPVLAKINEFFSNRPIDRVNDKKLFVALKCMAEIYENKKVKPEIRDYILNFKDEDQETQNTISKNEIDEYNGEMQVERHSKVETNKDHQIAINELDKEDSFVDNFEDNEKFGL